MSDPVGTSTLPVPVGVHTEAYLADKHQKQQELINIRDERRNNPGWNTLKEVVWVPLMSLFQLGQAVGSFVGHLVVAVPSAVLGSAFGLCVYAPFMKAVNLIAGRENTKSFFEYVITPAYLLSNIAYNRVTDILCRYVLGPSLVVTIVEPLLYLGVVAGVAVGLSPFIYRDFIHNNSRDVERYLDGPLATSVKWGTYHHIWQKFGDIAAGRRSKPMTLQERAAADIDACLAATTKINKTKVNINAAKINAAKINAAKINTMAAA